MNDMAKHGALLCSCAFSILLLTMSFLCKAIDQEDRKVQVVYMGSLPNDNMYSPSSHHLGMLERVVQGSSAADVLIRSYGRSFNGFAANLMEHERQKLANMTEVVSVFPSRTLQLHTTRSWDFMGMRLNITRKETSESNVIVGVMDTGLWPESPSFSGEGFGPVPTTWKGNCQGGRNYTCNNKIIGARYCTSDGNARDEEGHGSHTASMAAGNAVENVSFYGLGGGTARGGVPGARIVPYKVCGSEGCSSVALMAAFDDAAADNVSIITCSIGFSSPVEYMYDPIAIGSFHAMGKGILTAQSAGNSGPEEGTVSSVAPWIMTVAASTIDRKFVDTVSLANGSTLYGISVNSFTSNGSSYPLVYGAEASSLCSELYARYCINGCLDPDKVTGKIVMCDQFGGYLEANRAGAQGAILVSSREDVPFVVSLPATGLNDTEYEVAKAYHNSSRNPPAKIFKSEAIRDPTAPKVASFSSRGANQIAPEILKPDITGPGVAILAAYSPNVPPSGDPYDERRVAYNIISGTSMSCPHAAGVAAYVKEFHPDWSPAAIKSAIMTTAWPMNDSTSPGEFAYGAGHLNPVRARVPGLVYEASKQEHVKFLCTMMDQDTVRIISGDNSTCPTGSEKGSARDLNYPSMAANVTTMESFSIKFPRRVKNVGLENCTYKASVSSSSSGVDIKVVPTVLYFKSVNQEKNFTVTVAGSGLPEGSHVSASLVWSDGTHSVRSPIVLNSVAA